MRLATLALHLGFLVTSFVLGAASGRQQGVRAAASLDRVPVAGSIPETGAGVPSDEAAPPEESRALSEANGMDLVKLREALLMSSGASAALQNWETMTFLWALKDMQIVSRMADKAGLSLPIAGAIKELVKDGRRIKQTNPPDWTGRAAR